MLLYRGIGDFMEIREIERSIIKKFRKQVWGRFVRGVETYKLIQENDKIAVCISGGKDSFLLAKCIEELQKHGKVNFAARYLVMDPGYNKLNRHMIEENRRKHEKGAVCHERQVSGRGGKEMGQERPVGGLRAAGSRHDGGEVRRP